MLRPFLLLAAFFGFTGVALGAFATHGLEKQLNAEYLAVFQTGARHQLIHALTLFGVVLLATRLNGRLVSAAGGLFALDILLFSGSPHLPTLGDIGELGIVTPFGGVSSLAGWLYSELVAWHLGNA